MALNLNDAEELVIAGMPATYAFIKRIASKIAIIILILKERLRLLICGAHVCVGKLSTHNLKIQVEKT